MNKKSKKLLTLLALGIVAYGILKAMLSLGQTYFWIVYELLAGVPFIVYICIVRGRVGKPPTEEMLPDTWTLAEKRLFIEQTKEQHRKGKICMNIAFPFLMALLVAVVTEWYIPMLRR